MSLRRALFLDRDGVINIDHGYVHRVDQVDFVDGIFALCRAAQRHGYLSVVITNQAGIGRGYYDEGDFRALMSWMKTEFERAGASLDGVYHCPHHPVHGLGVYRIACACRKPEPGLLLAAQHELSLDLSTSVLIGDKMSDIEAGRRAGVGQRILLSGDAAALDGAGEAVLPSLDLIRFHLFGH